MQAGSLRSGTHCRHRYPPGCLSRPWGHDGCLPLPTPRPRFASYPCSYASRTHTESVGFSPSPFSHPNPSHHPRHPDDCHILLTGPPASTLVATGLLSLGQLGLLKAAIKMDHCLPPLRYTPPPPAATFLDNSASNPHPDLAGPLISTLTSSPFPLCAP